MRPKLAEFLEACLMPTHCPSPQTVWDDIIKKSIAADRSKKERGRPRVHGFPNDVRLETEEATIFGKNYHFLSDFSLCFTV